MYLNLTNWIKAVWNEQPTELSRIIMQKLENHFSMAERVASRKKFVGSKLKKFYWELSGNNNNHLLFSKEKETK